MSHTTIPHIAQPVPRNGTHSLPASPIATASKSSFLAKLTSLTTVASVAAAGMMVVGVLALLGGSYDSQVVHDQLAPQKIFFPAAGSKALTPGVVKYAGQQVLNGTQAKAYSGKISADVAQIAGGKTYAQVSALAIAAPKNATLAAEKATLFQGETLRGLLLGAWGWAMIGTIATLAGIILLSLGAILLLLPMLNWQVNLRRKANPAAA
jgi:hypothetical protein